MAAALRNDHAELERKLNAQLAETILKVMLKIDVVENAVKDKIVVVENTVKDKIVVVENTVMDKIVVIENAVMERFKGQPSQTLNPAPTPVCGGGVDFKVISSVSPVQQIIALILFQFSVKYHANRLLYPRTLPLSPLRLDVPSISEVLDFTKLPHAGPTIARFRIDPSSRPNSPWNLEACRVFAEDFCAKQHWATEGETLTDVSREFYMLIPEFATQHALASGFADLKSHNRFQESLRRRIRRHKVG